MSNPDERESVDKQIETYLTGRRGRVLESAQMAELEHAAEDEKTEAARSRKERQLVEGGKISPIKGEEVNVEDNKRVEDAAEVAAEAASAGVDVEEAADLGAGKKRVVVIKPESQGVEGEGRWSVMDGKPVKDPEGEYTFSQALKVASLEKAKTNDEPTSILKWLKEEGLLGGKKGDEFMSVFINQLAQQSVDNIVKPPSSGESSSVEILRAEMSDLRAELKTATDPVESAKRVKEMYDTFKSLSLVPEPPGGVSLEVTKETHRHDERMEAIQADREFRKTITDIAADIPDSIGRGLGAQLLKGEGSGSSGLEHIVCANCEFRIPITAETGRTVTCPKCNAAYDRKETSEAEQK